MLDIPWGYEKLEYVRAILVGNKCLQTFSKQKFSVSKMRQFDQSDYNQTISHISELMLHF